MPPWRVLAASISCSPERKDFAETGRAAVSRRSRCCQTAPGWREFDAQSPDVQWFSRSPAATSMSRSRGMHAVDRSSRCTTVVAGLCFVALLRLIGSRSLSIKGGSLPGEHPDSTSSAHSFHCRRAVQNVGGHGGDDVTVNGFAVGRKRLSIPDGCIGGRNSGSCAWKPTDHPSRWEPPLTNATQDPARGQSWMCSQVLRLVPGNGGQAQVARCKSRKA